MKKIIGYFLIVFSIVGIGLGLNETLECINRYQIHLSSYYLQYTLLNMLIVVVVLVNGIYIYLGLSKDGNDDLDKEIQKAKKELELKKLQQELKKIEG